MNIGITFALIAALAFGLWTVSGQQASAHINNLFGAVIVSLTAVLMGGVILFLSKGGDSFRANPKGIIFAILTGFCALAIDYFSLKTYGSGIPVSIGGPIIIAGGILVAVLIGLFFGESISPLKLLGILFVFLGVGILASLRS